MSTSQKQNSPIHTVLAPQGDRTSCSVGFSYALFTGDRLRGRRESQATDQTEKEMEGRMHATRPPGESGWTAGESGTKGRRARAAHAAGQPTRRRRPPADLLRLHQLVSLALSRIPAFSARRSHGRVCRPPLSPSASQLGLGLGGPPREPGPNQSQTKRNDDGRRMRLVDSLMQLRWQQK